MSDADRVSTGGLRVARELFDFVSDEALPGSGIAVDEFWAGVERVVAAAMPRNRELIAERARLTQEIDAWHRAYRGRPQDLGAYREFLSGIGYLVAEPSGVRVSTEGVDLEIADLAGPQLVVPVTNARYVLNAANARWGSLYDALYGTDALPGAPRTPGYDPERGAQVVVAVRELLDEFYPLQGSSHALAVGYSVVGGALSVRILDGSSAGLADPAALAGWRGDPGSPQSVLLRRHGLHWELRFDRSSPVGGADAAGLSDIRIEAALSTIVDFEDSVAVVDASDKVVAYRHWLRLNQGTLEETFDKGGRALTRRLEHDLEFTSPDGSDLVLPARSLLLVRNVGHLMTTDAVLDDAGAEIGEGILDTLLTTLCALPGRDPENPFRNGRTGSIYIVKPKMHGPAEVAFTVELFAMVEQLLGLPPRTLKLGLMDEERRTSVNLVACIAEARDRLAFVNTGFLDRSGDEIHTSFEAGPMVRKAAMRGQPWMVAYELQNVQIGVEVGLPGRGQIGKGMWAMPDRMADMLEQKIAHPLSGASTAWVPSPTAATLHALHYLRVDVPERRAALTSRVDEEQLDLLTIPLGDPAEWDEDARREELDNNVQSILGYVVRWIDQGIGCSKVPDIHDVGLMEDRATLRISSQLIANWVRHGVLSETQVDESLARMAPVVDAQNASDPLYRRMAPALDGLAMQAARQLILEGAQQPNGYTEPILHQFRRRAKLTALD